jgi:hypothetical protein
MAYNIKRMTNVLGPTKLAEALPPASWRELSERKTWNRERVNKRSRVLLPSMELSFATTSKWRLLGTAVLFGMLGVTCFGLLFTPAFYTFIGNLGSKDRLYG